MDNYKIAHYSIGRQIQSDFRDLMKCFSEGEELKLAILNGDMDGGIRISCLSIPVKKGSKKTIKISYKEKTDYETREMEVEYEKLEMKRSAGGGISAKEENPENIVDRGRGIRPPLRCEFYGINMRNGKMKLIIDTKENKLYIEDMIDNKLKEKHENGPEARRGVRKKWFQILSEKEAAEKNPVVKMSSDDFWNENKPLY